MRDLKTIPVDPENTSSRSPNSRHVELVGYKNIELEGVATSRDVIASWNIALKATEVEARRLEGV
jgi:transposase